MYWGLQDREITWIWYTDVGMPLSHSDIFYTFSSPSSKYDLHGLVLSRGESITLHKIAF